jgi:hypothetical protein
LLFQFQKSKILNDEDAKVENPYPVDLTVDELKSVFERKKEKRNYSIRGRQIKRKVLKENGF